MSSPSRENDIAKPRVEVDDSKSGFRFRVVKGTCAGPWTTYTGIAMLSYRSAIYYAVTAFHDGTFPIEKVFTIRSA